MNRIHQGTLMISTLVGSWLGMQAIHECGHAAGAWMTGGRVARVVLYPFTISRTDVVQNRRPLLVVWAGPVVGTSIPVVLWLIAAATKLRGTFVLRFFAGFCLLANGLYIGVGSFAGVGDCGEMLRHGSPIWHLRIFGAIAAPLGLWLWHRQGADFGLGPAKKNVDPPVAYTCLAGCVVLLALEFAIGS